MKTFKKYLEIFENISRSGVIPYVYKNNKYFIALMKPSDPRYGGEKFQICKGQIDNGYTSKETAVKECKQELGLKISENNLKLLWNNKKQNIQWYIINVGTIKKLIPEPNEDGIIETGEAKWFEIEEAEKIIRDWQKPILKMFKRKLRIKNN